MKRIAPILLLLLAAFGAGAYFALRRATPIAPPESPASPTASESTPAGTATPVRASGAPAPSAAASARAKDPRLPEETKALILDCARGAEGLRGVRAAGEFTTLDEYFSHAPSPAAGHTAPVHAVELRNLHVRGRDGTVLRLQLLPSRAGGEGDAASPRAEVRLFGVDSENLPVPRPLPPDWEGLGADRIIERFAAGGETLLDESDELYRWDDRTSGRVRRRNGRIEEMRLFFEGHELSCAQASCRCL